MSDESAADTKADEADEKLRARRFDWFTKVLLPLVCVVLGVAGKYAFDEWRDRLRVIEYAVVSSAAIFPKPDVGAQNRLEVTLNGKPISNMSTATLHVFNDNEDLEKLPLYVKIGPARDTQVISVHPKLEPEHFKVHDRPSTGPNDDGTLKYGFDIAVLNRNQTFQFDCLFVGDQAPPVELFTVSKGVTTRRVNLADREGSGQLLFRWADVLSAGLSAATAFVLLFVTWFYNRKSKQEFTHSDFFAQVMKERDRDREKKDEEEDDGHGGYPP